MHITTHYLSDRELGTPATPNCVIKRSLKSSEALSPLPAFCVFSVRFAIVSFRVTSFLLTSHAILFALAALVLAMAADWISRPVCLRPIRRGAMTDSLFSMLWPL